MFFFLLPFLFSNIRTTTKHLESKPTGADESIGLSLSEILFLHKYI